MQKPSVHVIAAAFATNITFEIVKSHWSEIKQNGRSYDVLQTLYKYF
jgi:hypothetical protein